MTDPEQPNEYEVLADTPQHKPQHKPQRKWNARRVDGTLPPLNLRHLINPQPRPEEK